MKSAVAPRSDPNNVQPHRPRKTRKASQNTTYALPQNIQMSHKSMKIRGAKCLRMRNRCGSGCFSTDMPHFNTSRNNANMIGRETSSRSQPPKVQSIKNPNETYPAYTALSNELCWSKQTMRLSNQQSSPQHYRCRRKPRRSPCVFV